MARDREIRHFKAMTRSEGVLLFFVKSGQRGTLKGCLEE